MLRSRLDNIDLTFPKLDVAKLHFSKEYWLQFSFAYSRGIQGIAVDSSNEHLTVRLRFDAGGYMIPHYENLDKVIVVEKGELTLKLYSSGTMTNLLTLQAPERYVIKANAVHSPESISGCQFLTTWK